MGSADAAAARAGTAIKIAVAFALAAVCFLAVYKYDNKYTAEGPKAGNGVLNLDAVSLEKHPVLFLVDGWEYYGGRLLTPEDFDGDPPLPDQFIYIGRFGGFENQAGGSPHGMASYRLNISIPKETDIYLLELPEIFSAYRLYVNGTLCARMGEPDAGSYRPETGNRSVSIEAGGSIELIFAVSDYSHFYSGMVYPPAFGEPEAVSGLLNARLILRSLLCAAALTIGALSVLVGLAARRDMPALLFGLLCLFFTGYAGYPLTLTLLSGSPVYYAAERISFCAMLCAAILTALRVSGVPRKWNLPAAILGGLICAVSAAAHLILPMGNLGMMLAYSRLVSAYEWVAAASMAAAVWYSVKRGGGRTPSLIYGVAIFICALVTDRLLPLHEPILTGWFIELSSFALVLCIGEATGRDVAARYREGAVMSERADSMERLYRSQLSHFQTIRREIEETKTLRHDMRHHIAVMGQYLQAGQYEKLGDYMKEYHAASQTETLPEYCPIDVINVLTHHYSAMARQNGIRLEIRCDLKASGRPEHVNMSSADLCGLYSNLMENAAEACLRADVTEKIIRVAVFRTAPDTLHLRILNTAGNVSRAGGVFLSSKRGGKRGYGLSSVEAIAEKYGGTAEFIYRAEKSEFESRVVVTA